MGIIQRAKDAMQNTKATFQDAKNHGITDAVINSGKRFGAANRRMVKTLGEGVRRRRK